MLHPFKDNSLTVCFIHRKIFLISNFPESYNKLCLEVYPFWISEQQLKTTVHMTEMMTWVVLVDIVIS
jgi:hypothetical protein